MGAISISIIIPARNEERRIAACLEEVVAHCQINKWDYEIIVVEDGSTDNTAKIVNDFRTHDNSIRLLSLPGRLGKGGSIVIAALSAISKDLMSYMDVDLAAKPSELQKLIENIHDSEIVIGSRILRGDLPPVRRPLHREILSQMYSKTFRVLFRMPIHDPQCGLKLFRSYIIPKLFGDLDVSGFAFDSEIIVKASFLGLKLKEIPINWSHRGQSTLSVLSEMRSMGLDLLSIWYKYHRLWRQGIPGYPQKKGSIYGRCLFEILSRFRQVKGRHLIYSDYKNLTRKLAIPIAKDKDSKIHYQSKDVYSK